MGGARKVILGVSMSLDGRIARANGGVDFLRTPREHPIGAFFASMDTAIMGRKTLDAGLRMTGGKLPKTEMKIYVMSRTTEPGERSGVIFVNELPGAFVAWLRKQSGTDIWLMGGGELTREFLREDLVDEMYLGIAPVLLGEGIPLFPIGFPQRDFALTENKSYAEGLVALRYERTREMSGPGEKKTRAIKFTSAKNVR
ncbi:MAG TPA: dihydrofolate reductase family protein [Candidatus Cybelea sp.]|nr:dihydrofolate reductase family protein [Candidatus Cybelea sp.]